MRSIHAPKRFAIWSRIKGEERSGATGRIDAVLWPVHEHREVDMRICRRCGMEHGFEGMVVGLTIYCESQQLAGLMVREREPSRLTASCEIELERILGLRDSVYQRLMLGSHAAIDAAIVKSLGNAAASGFGSARRVSLGALGRFVERRELSLTRVVNWLEAVDAGILLDDPSFAQTIRAA